MTEGLLLDTHVFLCWQDDDAQLRPEIRDRIAVELRVFLSADRRRPSGACESQR